MSSAGSRMRLEDFSIKEEISKGSFGIVFRIVRKADNRVFALKQVKLAGMKRVDRQEAIDEARVLSQLQHPHITRHYDSFIDKDDKLNIIMEYASRGNVSLLIKGQRGKGLPEDTIWKIFIQSLLALNYMHNKKIIHRDIKALNLFLDQNNNIKLGDLGIARALGDGSEFAHTIVGTPYYLAPELCEDKPYNEKSDVWALGVVLYECCMGHYPFEAQNEGALIRKILRGQFTPVSGPYTGALVQLISTLMTFKASQRPDTNQLMKHPTVLQKAKVLGIDLNPKLPATVPEDAPVFEIPPPAQQQPSAAYNPSQQPYGSPGMAYGAVQGQQYGHAVLDPAGAPRHPFELPPQAAQQAQHGMLPGRPSQGAGPTAATFDRMANDLAHMGFGGPGRPGSAQQQRPSYVYNQQHQQPGASPAPAAKQDNFREVFAHPHAATPNPGRLRPEELPAAGAVHASNRPQGAAPFALHVSQPEAQTVSQLQSSAVWTAKYTPPQYGRRRCPELQITGPSLRGGPGARPGSAGAGGYVPAADDATSYVSSSYATYYNR